MRGIIFGAYDLMHEGHLASLEEAKQHCSHLTVGLHVNPAVERPEQKAVPSEELWVRHQRLLSCRFVDRVICYEIESDIINILKTLPLDVRFTGADYIGKPMTGDDLDIPIFYLQRRHNQSSTNKRNK